MLTADGCKEKVKLGFSGAMKWIGVLQYLMQSDVKTKKGYEVRQLAQVFG